MKQTVRICLLVIGILAFGIGMLWVFRTAVYSSADSIEKAGYDTWDVLQAYERSGDVGKVHKWLIEYHGEGPGMQVMFTLGQWSVRHPDAFIQLIDAFPKDKYPTFVMQFSFCLSDGGQDKEFRLVFSKYKSLALVQIMDNIPHLIPWPKVPAR
jgi:hypothetical protein